MKRIVSFAVAAVMAVSAAAPARADAVTDLIDRGNYYLQLAMSSLDLSQRVSAKREKCQWARQAQGEYRQAVPYYDAALQRSQNEPGWTAPKRQRLAEMVEGLHQQEQRVAELVSKIC